MQIIDILTFINIFYDLNNLKGDPESKAKFFFFFNLHGKAFLICQTVMNNDDKQ